VVPSDLAAPILYTDGSSLVGNPGYACAVLSKGTMRCWGASNAAGSVYQAVPNLPVAVGP
jgi:hypothetical protein